MKEFSKLALRQAGQIGLGTILALNIGLGASIYGIYSYNQEQELVAGLKTTATQMSAEKSSIAKIRGYFDAEAGRIEAAHVKNGELLRSATDLSEWLPALPGAPTIDELKVDEAAKYVGSKDLLRREREASELVWTALSSPEKVPELKAGLTRANLELYSSVKSCAMRGAGEGAYCGPSAAVGARLVTMVAQAQQLKEQSEAYGRQTLGLGWDEWDGAQKALTESATKEIDKSRLEARAAFDRGDLAKDEWDSMSSGFNAAQATASNQIQQDRAQLQSHVGGGHMTAFDWYLLSRWTQSSPTQTVHLVSNPYVAGGSSFVPPASVVKSMPLPVAQAGSVARFAPPAGVNPYSVAAGGSHLGSKVSASFAQAAGPKISMAMSSAGSKGGMGARVSSFSAARGAARASSVGSAGVSHASAGHGVSSGG